MDRASENPVVPMVLPKPGYRNEPGVRIQNVFPSFYQSIPFRLQAMAYLRRGDNWQMWQFLRV